MPRTTSQSKAQQTGQATHASSSSPSQTTAVCTTSTGDGLTTQSAEQLSHEEAVSLIRLATVGAGQIEIAEEMAGWNPDKQAGGWRIVTQYFRSLAEIDHTLERGKALARYQMLFNACVRIQDWKAAAMIQSQIDKLTRS